MNCLKILVSDMQTLAFSLHACHALKANNIHMVVHYHPMWIMWICCVMTGCLVHIVSIHSPPQSLGIMEDIFKVFRKLLQNYAILTEYYIE